MSTKLHSLSATTYSALFPLVTVVPVYCTIYIHNKTTRLIISQWQAESLLWEHMLSSQLVRCAIFIVGLCVVLLADKQAIVNEVLSRVGRQIYERKQLHTSRPKSLSFNFVVCKAACLPKCFNRLYYLLKIGMSNGKSQIQGVMRFRHFRRYHS